MITHKQESARKASWFPREHGAWGMLGQPFLGALAILAIVGERIPWAVVPAAAAVLVVFLIREPLIVVARQRWVWRDAGGERAESRVARRYVAVELAVLGAMGLWLLTAWPWWLVAALGAGAGALTALAVYVTIRNRQRAVWFQALSAAGLSASGVAACLAVTGTVPGWGWWWWGLHAAHFLAGILVVHVRLEARIAARKGSALGAAFLKARRDAGFVLAAFAVAGAAMFAVGKPWYGGAAVASAVWSFYNLYSAHTAEAVAMAMTSVGKRALAASLVFTVVVGVGAVLGG